MLLLVTASLVFCQDPQPQPPQPPQPPAPVESPAKQAPPATAEAPKVVEAWDDPTAKAKVKDFQKLLKGKPGMAARNQALDQLAGGANAQLVKPLAQVVQTDESIVLRKRAAELLGNQPVDKTNAVILRLLEDGKVASTPPVQAELVRALSRCGYEAKHWKQIDDLFERDYDPARVAVHEAILDLVIAHEEVQALPLLLRNLDEPVPQNVDAAHNPPAEYWKARWTSWSAWRGKVKDALFAVTGQRFSTAAEAKAWLDKNPVRPKPKDKEAKPDK